MSLQDDGRFATSVELSDGNSRLVVQVTDPEGRSGTIEHDVEAPRHQLFLMAFADGKIGSHSGDGAFETTGLADDSDLYFDGRLAFYAKGRILGKYLITAAFDSSKGRVEHLFDQVSVEDNEALLRNLDPDRYYTVYGDSSTIGYDAQSEGKLYLALESEQINAGRLLTRAAECKGRAVVR